MYNTISAMPSISSTDISLGTSANTAYELYVQKQREIRNLEFERDLLINKYHDEMKKAIIPSELTEIYIVGMFDDSNKTSQSSRRKYFLEKVFSEDFLKKHKIDFIRYTFCGYSRYAVIIALGIGNHEYCIECPLPLNIASFQDCKMLMGEVKYRADRICKSQANSLIREMESVCPPTYDWTACFAAIERAVESEAKENTRK